MSQSSGCYDSDSAEPCPTDDTADGHPYPARDGARGSGLRRQAIQNWHRRPYRNSTEGEEGDVSDVGSRTTESEAEGWEPEATGSAASRPTGSCRLTGETAPGSSGGVGGLGGWKVGDGDGSSAPGGVSRPCCPPWPPVATDGGCPTARTEGAGGKVGRLERGSPGHSSEVISPEILKMRAALFCIFTYLDTKTLLRAAEVCKDWKFVARHPAVWTRVLLENARVSSKVPGMALPRAKPFIHLACVDCHTEMAMGMWVHTAACLHQRLDALHVHMCIVVGVSSHAHAFSCAFVVTPMILLHTLLHDLICAFSHIYGMCVHAEMPVCVCMCAHRSAHGSQGWVAWGMPWAFPSVMVTPVPPVPGHAVSVVHPDALPHPPKPQATPAGEEGEQGGLHEEHAVSPRIPGILLLQPEPLVLRDDTL